MLYVIFVFSVSQGKHLISRSHWHRFPLHGKATVMTQRKIKKEDDKGHSHCQESYSHRQYRFCNINQSSLRSFTSLMSSLVLLWPLLLGNYPVQMIFWRNGLLLVLNHDLRLVVILYNTSQRLPIHAFLSVSVRWKKKKFRTGKVNLRWPQVRDFCTMMLKYFILSILANLKKQCHSQRFFEIIFMLRR